MKESIYCKVMYFSEKNKKVHVVLISRRFLNGEITRVTPDYFVINELKEGETPVAYSEVLKVTEFRNKEQGYGITRSV